MNDIWWGRCDFRISFSGRVMSRNVLNRLWGISMVGTGILSNNMRSPFPECYMIFWKMTIYSDTHHWSDITKCLTLLLFSTLLQNLTFYLIVREVSIEYLQRVRHANRGRFLLRTPGPFPLWDLNVLMLWPISPELVMFPDFWDSNEAVLVTGNFGFDIGPKGYLLYHLWSVSYNKNRKVYTAKRAIYINRT